MKKIKRNTILSITTLVAICIAMLFLIAIGDGVIMQCPILIIFGIPACIWVGLFAIANKDN